MSTLKIKQGEAFVFLATYLYDDGITPKSLDGVILSSQIRDRNYTLVADLTVAVSCDDGGSYELSALTTADWPPGPLYWDIKETTSEGTRLSQTMTIIVERAVTL